MCEVIHVGDLERASDLLKDGQVVAFPTETVYGLGANATSPDAVAKIFEAKNRPQDNPLIVHVSGIKMLEALLEPDQVPSVYLPIIEKYWPGPLTILVKRPRCIPEVVSAGQETIGIRMPSHPVALKLIELCGFPLAAPSANLSGRPSPTTSMHVFDDLKFKIPMIVEGGSCESGVESTVLDCLRPQPAILRPGGVTAEELKFFLPDLVVYRKDFTDKNLEDNPTTPGMKYRHYTPNAKVVLVEFRGNINDQLLLIKSQFNLLAPRGKVGVLSVVQQDFPLEINMGNTSLEIAKNIFSSLRKMEEFKVDYIIVQGILDANQGLAVMNRLRKAASIIL